MLCCNRRAYDFGELVINNGRDAVWCFTPKCEQGR